MASSRFGSKFNIPYSSFSIPTLILTGLIIAYALYFSWYTINRHSTLNSYAADLSLIDQPMWNTALGPGYFMELTWGDHQQPRLAEHFEPILVPLAMLFYLWDDVRILLIAQSVALALGALPVFWIARSQLSTVNYQLKFQPSNFRVSTWAALIFAGVYLLSPQLQAANIADFHADPFVVTPLLLAFWYATQKRWGRMWVWAIIAMATKETLPTLTAMLGLFLIYISYQSRRSASHPSKPHQNQKHLHCDRQGERLQVSTIQNGLALIVISTAWFLLATFLIVAPLARQYFGSDGPIYLASRYSGGLGGLPSLLQDRARWQYVFGLLASVGFLPLLAPELLILGLPVLMANLLSNFPGQYSGEQHYSVPLVVGLIIAAIYGTRRLVNNISLREERGQTLRLSALVAALLWLASWSLGYHTIHGWTPLSTRLERYYLTPAATRLPDLMAQVPAETVLSASAAIHPHLAHRRVIYTFPTVQEATHFLVDVTDISGVHPNDAQARIVTMLNTDWRLIQADQGLILAQKSTASSPVSTLPDSFYDFARTTTRPRRASPLLFGDGDLQLLGYDLHDDPDDGVSFRFYWQATKNLPDDLRLWPLVYDDLGRLLADPTQVPMIAAVWYAPSAWQAGETVVTETLPQLLPDTFHVGIAAGPEDSFFDPSQRWPVANNDPDHAAHLYPGNWAQLDSFKRQGTFLTWLPPGPTFKPLTPTSVQFGPAMHLTGYWFDPQPPTAGGTMPVLLQWTASKPPQADFTVFVHLVDPDGTPAAQSDATPTWLTPVPTSHWPAGQPMLDSHTLSLPEDLPAGNYSLQVGLYHPQTLERLKLPDGNGTFFLGSIERH